MTLLSDQIDNEKDFGWASGPRPTPSTAYRVLLNARAAHRPRTLTSEAPPMDTGGWEYIGAQERTSTPIQPPSNGGKSRTL